jgi:hypothetical protein
MGLGGIIGLGVMAHEDAGSFGAGASAADAFVAQNKGNRTAMIAKLTEAQALSQRLTAFRSMPGELGSAERKMSAPEVAGFADELKKALDANTKAQQENTVATKAAASAGAPGTARPGSNVTDPNNPARNSSMTGPLAR